MSTTTTSISKTNSQITGIAGQFYHIKEQFFVDVQEPKLMSNKENGGYRPHYLAVHDSNNMNILWMIPVSSRYAKYQDIYNAVADVPHLYRWRGPCASDRVERISPPASKAR